MLTTHHHPRHLRQWTPSVLQHHPKGFLTCLMEERKSGFLFFHPSVISYKCSIVIMAATVLPHSVVQSRMRISLFRSMFDIDHLYPPRSRRMALTRSERNIWRFVFEQRSLRSTSRDDYVAHAGRCTATHDASRAKHNKPSFAGWLGKIRLQPNGVILKTVCALCGALGLGMGWGCR